MTRTICRVVGWVLLVVGFAGFAAPSLLGMHLTPMHNIIHLVTAALALYFGYVAPEGTRAFCWIFGVVYLALGVLGFFAPEPISRLLGSHTLIEPRELTPDNVVHLILGGALLVGALLSVQLPTPPRRRPA
jgi:hypothetical protein